MTSSCYFGFDRKPGLNGNSIYLMAAEDCDNNIKTAREITQKELMIDSMKNATNPIAVDIRSNNYSKMCIPDDSDMFISNLGMNHTDKTGNKLTIRDEITNENAKNVAERNIISMYAKPTLNNNYGIINGNWQIKEDNDGMDKFNYHNVQAESAYIGMPNLYNFSNIKGQKNHYNIRPPKFEKYVIEEPIAEQDEDTEYKIPETKEPYKNIINSQQFSDQNDAQTFDNTSEAYTTYNFDVTTIESEYAFNVEQYGNINEEFPYSIESNKAGISANEGNFPNSYTSKTETDGGKDTTSTMIASKQHYIKSYYNANDLSQWNIY
ncbi:unnamed protein product [Cercopithifilaria johnstoni]|uniref:Uncharacterized protein n=1 Tax=Cercopithifilaria johnstoni TaxID=2874296 RepID=A0A8J2LXN1_9BILA|nr:unnamed protein product [Cercopithifilaria johnstoni]